MTQRTLRRLGMTPVWLLGTVLAVHLNCTQPLTVQDAQTGLTLACHTLAAALHSQHPGSSPAALQIATEACNAELTTKLMSVLLADPAAVPLDGTDAGAETSPSP